MLELQNGGFLDAAGLCDYHQTQPRSIAVQQVMMGSSGAKPSFQCQYGFLSSDIPKIQKGSDSSNSSKSKLGSKRSLFANDHVSKFFPLSQHFFHKKHCYRGLKP